MPHDVRVLIHKVHPHLMIIKYFYTCTVRPSFSKLKSQIKQTNLQVEILFVLLLDWPSGSLMTFV